MTTTRMSFLLAVTMVAATVAETASAQTISQLGTRRGALAGAVIGGIVGNQNNETLAGVAIGGLVGGVAGRAIGNRIQSNSYIPQQQFRGPVQTYVPAPTYSQAPVFYSPQPRIYQPQYAPIYRQPTYSRGFGGGCSGGGFYGR